MTNSLNLPNDPTFPRRWDNSQLEEARRCMRRFLYRYCWNLVPIRKASALSYGSAIHEMLAALYTGHPNPIEAFEASAEAEGFTEAHYDKRRNPEVAQAYLDDYVHTYANDPMTPLRVEVKQSLPLNDFTYTIKIDLVGKLDGGVFGMDHKTSSLNRELFMTTAPLANQFTGYAWGLSQIFDSTTFAINALYLGVATPALRFQRYYHTYSENEISEWFASTLWRILQLENLRERIDQPIFWEKNAPSACVAYFKLCPYHAICEDLEGSRYLLADNYRREVWLPEDADDGAEAAPVVYVPKDDEPMESIEVKPRNRPKTIEVDDDLLS